MTDEPKVYVTFVYEPDDPDPDDSTGVSEAEFEWLMEQLMTLGAYDIQIERRV